MGRLPFVLSAFQRCYEFVPLMVFGRHSGIPVIPFAYGRFERRGYRAHGVLRVRERRARMESLQPHEPRNRNEMTVPMDAPPGVRGEKPRVVDWGNTRGNGSLGKLASGFRRLITCGVDGNLLSPRHNRRAPSPSWKQRIRRIRETGPLPVRTGSLVENVFKARKSGTRKQNL